MAITDPLALQVLAIAKEAGDKIMDIYDRDFAIYEKQDTSPLTEADLAAHKSIVAGLEAISELPILSEESADISWDERKTWDKYWLVDPLDGTKEFIKKNGEFTVNIAHVRNGIPEMGAVHVPVSGVTYLGKKGLGAWRVDRDDFTEEIHSRKIDTHSRPLKVLASRSHRNDSLDNLIQWLGKSF